MINDRISLDMTAKVVRRWVEEGGSISTSELQKLSGNDYTVYNGTLNKAGKKAKNIAHKFGRVVETQGRWFVAVGVNGDRWVQADEEGPVIAERYKAIKADNDKKSSERKNRKPSNRKPRGYWTKERILELASQYASRSEFRKKENSAYQSACLQKIMHLLPE